jgi:hypothetical protein
LPAFLALKTLTTGVPAWLVTAEAASIVALCLAGEFMERRLFFVAVQPVKMPGGVPA